jgi:hypothetical protein
VKTSTWIALSVVLVASILVNLWSKSNRETALVSSPNGTYEPAPTPLSTEEKPDSKAPNSKYQTLWNDFARLSNEELLNDYKVMSDPTKNIPVCELDQSKLTDAGKDRVYLLTVGYICRHSEGGYGYAAEPGFLARRSQDINVNKGFSITPDTPLVQVKEQIELYLKTNRNTDANSVKKPN